MSGLGNVNYQTFDPQKNIENETFFVEATLAELEEAATLAEATGKYRVLEGLLF